MLRAESEKHRKRIDEMLQSFQICFNEAKEDGVLIDDYITYDQMAMIVDYLRAKKT